MAREDSNGPGVFAPASNVIERKQGCWNCKHWENQEKSRGVWNGKRFDMLNEARVTAMLHPQEGEKHGKVVSIRRMVDQMDRAVASGTLGICLSGSSETDFCHNAYLCGSWSAAEGASLAIAGEGLDKLPEELKAERDKQAEAVGEQTGLIKKRTVE